MKKLLLCLCSAALLFTLAACGEDTSSEYTDAESVAKAKSRLYYSNFENNIISDFTLTVDCAFGVTASYVSSNTDVVSINGANATVTRPDSDEENVDLTLTATLTKGEAKDTIVYNITVEKMPSFTLTTLASVASGSENGNLVKVEGAIVVGVQKYCLYITDNNKVISVNGPTTGVSIGDAVTVIGTVGNVFGMPTIGSQSDAAIIQSNGKGSITVDPIVVTLEEIVAWTSEDALYTDYLQLTAVVNYDKLEESDQYPTLRFAVGDTYVEVHYHSAIASNLQALNGEEVTINFGVRSLYNGIWGIYAYEIVTE